MDRSATDMIDVEVSVDGGAAKVTALAHKPGDAQGSVEIDFPNSGGYPVGKRVHIHVGPALEMLPTLNTRGPFDLVFIDADKQSTPDYFTWALVLTRPGSVIVTDNVIRAGALIDPDCEDPRVEVDLRRSRKLVRDASDEHRIERCGNGQPESPAADREDQPFG